MKAVRLRSAARMPRVAIALWFGGALLASTTASADTGAQDLIAAARRQVGVTRVYDGSYVQLAYPGGDVPAERGVCTDVLIRAYRELGVDLQVRVHEDMRSAWSAYPKLWGLARPDRNIDHRRVPNLATFLGRHGKSIAVSGSAADFEPGDLVTWRLPGGAPHIGIVSDRNSASGVPLVLHNIGAGAAEEDVLFRYEITGHYRYAPEGDQPDS